MNKSKASESSRFSLPFVWPSLGSRAEPESEDDGFPLDHLVTGGSDILGIVSDLDDPGLEWLKKRLQEESWRVSVIVAVYAGCPTRSKHLSQLLDLQKAQEAQKKPGSEFRILPMKVRFGAPANCLTVLPEDKSSPVFLFGSTPNFGLTDPDPTQFSLAFRAELSLIGEWTRWFDSTWQQAVPLTKDTAQIPDLVPAVGSSVAAAHWQDYCQRCIQAKQKAEANATSSFQGSESSVPASISNQTTDQPSSKPVGIPEPDQLADRVMRLVAEGKQVTVDHGSAVAPLVVPVPPHLLRQSAEKRVGTVIQRQSFRISVFSKEELKKIDDYRKKSQEIISKLSLPIGIGLYWIPDNMIPIYEHEVSVQEKEARKYFEGLVGSDSHGFVEGKRNQIERDLQKIYRQIGGKGDLPPATLTEVLDDLQLRIESALMPGTSILAPVTYASIAFDLRKGGPQESPWAQVGKLILALARFPREVIRKPKSLGLATPKSKILSAMNIADDVILKSETENRRIVQDTSVWQLRLLDDLGSMSITQRSCCEACLMVIDGDSPEQINSYISKELSKNSQSRVKDSADGKKVP